MIYPGGYPGTRVWNLYLFTLKKHANKKVSPNTKLIKKFLIEYLKDLR